MRGEEPPKFSPGIRLPELPPHARRRGHISPGWLGKLGITSACAEKSEIEAKRDPSIGNYLRMRGEETPRPPRLCRLSELPPHARRRGTNRHHRDFKQGITSACAEKRAMITPPRCRGWNYLRMRGEESLSGSSPCAPRELPPHARRRGPVVATARLDEGITSACAEKSARRVIVISRVWNYLRMRGEEPGKSMSWRIIPELPPHARRRAL